MKYALTAVILTMLFALQSALAAESDFEITENLFEKNEQLPKTVKKPEATTEAATEEDYLGAAEVPLALEEKEPLTEEQESALPEQEQQSAVTDGAILAEFVAPGTMEFEMATIDMISDAPETNKKSFSEIAKSR